MPVFTPPATSSVPPVLPDWSPEQTGPARRLFSHYRSRPEGVNVYLLSDGTITEDDPDGTLVVWSRGDRNGEALNAKYVVVAWYGGHDNYEVTAAQANALVGAGYTVTDTTPPEPDPPTLTSLSPNSGQAGTTVTAQGTNLSEVTTLTFDGSSIAFTILSSTAVRFTVPALSDGTYDVVLSNLHGSSGTVSFALSTPVPGSPPDITAVSPSSGVAGVTITLTGSSFEDISSVTIDGNPVSYSNPSSTSITFTAPAHADGTVTIQVTTADGSDTATFTYSTPAPGDPHPGNDLLLEDGSFLLLEDGTSTLLLES